MKKGEILKGIAAYGKQQQDILKAIEKHGGRLHQDDFDKEFEECCHIWPSPDEAFILGGIQQIGDWSRYLDLIQLMAQAGIVRIEGTPPNIVYATQKETP